MGALARLLAAWDTRDDGSPAAVLPLSPAALTADPVLSKLFAAPSLTLRLAGPSAESTWVITESQLPGLWQVLAGSGHGSPISCQLELGACPARVATGAAAVALPPRAVPTQAPRPELSELWLGIRQALGAVACDTAPRVFNLSVLKLEREDRDALAQALGHAAVMGRLEGQFLRLIFSTRLQRVWRVQYLDANSRVQVDTLEIGVLPECLAATPAELECSLARLRVLQPSALATVATQRRHP